MYRLVYQHSLSAQLQYSAFALLLLLLIKIAIPSLIYLKVLNLKSMKNNDLPHET